MGPASKVICQGVKRDWETRNTINVMLVEHSSFNVLEIITYDLMLDREAPRLYVNHKAVLARLKRLDYEQPVREAKNNFDKGRFLQRAAFDFLTSHLLILVYSLPERKIVVALRCEENIEVEKPMGLAPFQSPNYHTLL